MNRDFFLALESGCVPTTFEAFSDQFSQSLGDVTFNGDTALHIAAREGHLRIVEWILQLRPSLARARNKVRNTPLHEAVKTGNRELIQKFLESTNYHCDKFMFLPFVEFFVDLLKNLLKMLFLFKIPSDKRYNRFGETPLVIASQYGHVEAVKLLLEVSSSQYAVTELEWHRSAREAAYRGYEGGVVAMLEYKRHRQDTIWTQVLGSIRAYFQPGMCEILHAAVQGGHLEIVKVLLDHRSWRNYSVTEEDEHGRCPVHVAAIKGRLDIIKEFKSRMPDSVYIHSSKYKTVLHFAVEYNQIQIVQDLLADKDAGIVAEMVSRDRDSFGNTALHMAATNGANSEILEFLLSLPHVDVNALNEEGKTALDIASAAAEDIPNCAAKEAIRSTPLPSDSKQGADTDTVNTHMVVASLIATVTFAAMFQIPGGIEDEQKSVHYGAAKPTFDRVFRLFLFSDTVAFASSLTVVVGWLLRQHWYNIHLDRFLSNLSEVSLLVSTVWTAVTFLTATIIVIIPRNLNSLKSKDKEAFRIYKTLWQNEIKVLLLTPVFIAATFSMALPGRLKKISSVFLFLCFQMSYFIYGVFYCSFKMP